MSYILSALKKVERKRQSEHLPDLLSMQVEHASADAARGGRGRVILKTVVVTGLLVAVGGWFLSPVSGGRTMDWLGEQWSSLPFSRMAQPVISSGETRRETAAPAQSVYRTVEVREFSPPLTNAFQPPAKFPEPLARAAPPAPLKPLPRTASPRTASPPAASPPGAAPDAALSARAAPVDFDNLPPDTRRRIPVFSVTGHLYSNMRPQANKVIINGAALREGQYVSEDLMVSEITDNGVIMDFRGLHFRVGKARIFQ